MFAYGPADATAIPKPHHLLPHLDPDWFYLSGTGLSKVVMEKEAIKWQYCSRGSSNFGYISATAGP